MPSVNHIVQPLLDEFISRDVERGLQVAAYLNGELILDAWSGLADAGSSRRVDGDTLFVAFSCGKGVVATAIHLLADRGHLRYDDTIATYWPEFAVAGKHTITLRQVLAHTAGIPHLPAGTTIEDLCDWDRICAGIARLEPLWEPGARTAYHARSFGFILGEVIRRIDGRGFNQFVHEELCRPLSINDLHFGLPVELESRVAHLEDLPPPIPVEVTQDSLFALVFPPNLPPTAALLDQPAVHRATIPSSAGIMNARSLARMYAALANGGELDGVRILSSDRIALATAMQTDAVDGVISLPVRKALGYFLGDEQSPMGDDVRVFGHAGSGGSIGFADPRHRFAFALTKTRLVSSAPGEDAASRVASAARSAVGIMPTKLRPESARAR